MSCFHEVKAVFCRIPDSNGNLNKEDSYWVVFDGDIILSQISVKEFCNKNPSLDYDTIATMEFGRIFLKKVTKMKAYW